MPLIRFLHVELFYLFLYKMIFRYEMRLKKIYKIGYDKFVTMLIRVKPTQNISLNPRYK